MRTPRQVISVVVLAILVIGVAALALSVGAGSWGGGSNQLALPALYPEIAVAPLERELSAVRRSADATARRWLAAHPRADARSFAAFAVAATPAPPGPSVQRRELAQLRALTSHRTPQGEATARWMEANGKKKLWKLYGKQARALTTSERADREKAALQLALKMAADLSTQVKDRVRRISPYQVDPRVHGLNQVRFRGTRRYSYPSKHAAASYAAATVLDRVDPARATDVDHLAAEVSYSRLYAGGHYLSDDTAGARLGTLIGEYALSTEHLGAPELVPAK